MKKKETYVLTEANMELVMKAINKFFATKTKEFHKGMVFVGTREHKDAKGNILYCQDVHRKGIVETPYLGECKVHHCFKDNTITSFAPPILAVSAKYASNCIPLYEGAHITISRGILYLEEMWPGIDNLNNRFAKFKHADYSDAERNKVIKDTIIGGIFDDALSDDMLYEEYGSWDRCGIQEIRSQLLDRIDEVVRGEEDGAPMPTSVSFTCDIDMDDAGAYAPITGVKVSLDFEEYLKNPNSSAIKETYSVVLDDGTEVVGEYFGSFVANLWFSIKNTDDDDDNGDTAGNDYCDDDDYADYLAANDYSYYWD